MVTPHDPFSVDTDKALDVLVAAWEPAGYDQIGFLEGTGWFAYHKDVGHLDPVQAATPGELDAKIRENWQRRQGEAR